VTVKGLLLTFVVLAGMVLCFRCSVTPPSDAALVRKFHANRELYERLRAMLVADENIAEVYVRAGVQTLNGRGLSAGRHAEYVGLLKKTGARSVFRGNRRICMGIWGAGFGGNTRHILVCSLDVAPDRQTASLDEFYRTPLPRTPVYRHVAGQWYFWADW
jgi:hypothetical protein